MTSTMKVCNPLPQTGSLLAELVEEIAEKFQAGEAVDLEAFAAAHPEVAEQIRQLIPTVQVLAQLGRSAADGDPAAIALVSAAPVELGRLGDYRILREAGRGGMGIVYEAEQISLRRRVALKVLPFAAVLDPRQLQRFQNEAQAAAHLHHHHIVPVYGVGCERGIHYYAMQFIEGHSVAALIAEWRRWSGLDSSEQEAADTSAYELAGALASGARQPSPIAVEDANAAAAKHGRAADATIAAPRAGTSTDRSSNDPAYFHAIARLGVQAAKALEHAHEMGVIHRDIKPANLLVDMRGNLWITDFGLALSQNQASLTMTGDLVGTLRYMSPEQALANRGLIDHRTDIYSLGATLYEMLTLEPVFGGQDRQELLRQIAFEEPRPPRRWNECIPAELETIVLKATAKSPPERYATVQELAEDLERFLKDEPIRARRASLSQRARKWARRHRGVVWACAVFTAVLGVVLMSSLAIGLVLMEQANRRTKYERDLAKTAEKQAREASSNARAVTRFLVEDLLAEASPERNPSNKHVSVQELLDRAAKKVDRSFTGRPETEAAVRLAIGTTYRSLGRYAEAEAQQRTALDLRQTVLGPDHADTVEAVHELAIVLREEGKLLEAEKLSRQALEGFTGSRGAEHPDTLSALDVLGVVLMQEQKLDEASSCIEKCLEARRRVLGPEHPDTLIALSNLATVLWQQGKLGESESLTRECLEARRRVSGADHPETLNLLNHLGEVLQDRGKLTEAEPFLRQALEGWRRVSGAEHPDTLIALSNLATLFAYQGKLADAEPLYREVLEARRRVLGAEHFDTLHAASSLIAVLRDLGKVAEAEQLGRQSVGLARKALPPEHPILSTLLAVLGAILTDTGHADEAEPLLREVLTIRRKTFPKDHWQIASAENVLGGCLTGLKRYAEAEPLLLGSYEALAASPSPPPRRVREARQRVIKLYQTWGKPEKAAKWLGKG